MFQHITVLLEEAVDGLAIKPGGIYVDCTLAAQVIVKELCPS